MYIIYNHPDFIIKEVLDCFKRYSKRAVAGFVPGDIFWVNVEIDPKINGLSRVTVKNNPDKPDPSCNIYYQGKGHEGWLYTPNSGNQVSAYRIYDHKALLDIVEAAGPKITSRDCFDPTENLRLYHSFKEMLIRDGGLEKHL